MAFVKVQLDAKEPTVAPEDEYELRIIKVTEGVSGPSAKIPGEPYLNVMLRIEDGATEYLPLYEILMIPTSKTAEENVDRYKLNIQRFLNCFNISGDADGFDTDDFPGSTGRSLVVQAEDSRNGEQQNKLRLPRIEKKSSYKTTSQGKKGKKSDDDEIPF